MNANGAVALEWAERGWSVFDLAPRSKEPLAGSNGVKDATRDPVIIQQKWNANPNGNIAGVPPEGHVVIDIDPRNGGDRTLAELEAQHGELPPTWTHATGRGDGGLHLLYRLPDGVAAKQVRFGKGIDVKAGPGGYVLLPDSIHPDTGDPYVLVDGGQPVTEVPAWAIHTDESRPAPAKPRRTRYTGDDLIGEFNRDNTFHDLLTAHRWELVSGDGDSPGSEWRHPQATNTKSASIGEDGRLYVYTGNTPLLQSGDGGEGNGHDQFDVHVRMNFGGSRDAALASLRRATDSKPSPRLNGRRFTTTPASAIEAKVVDWWEECWIPRAALTLIAGREGLGKSTVAVDFAARETRQGGVVLYLDSEDSRAHTIRPRLQAAGADLDRVHFLTVTENDGGQEFEASLSLPTDFEPLRQVVQDQGVTFIILDAASSFIDQELKSNQDRDIRRFLEPFRKLAEDFNLVVAGIVHFGKRDSIDSGKLILGSIAWSQVARSVLALAHNAETDELVITNAKGNLAPRKRSEKLAVVSKPIMIGNETTSVGGIEWRGESDVSATDLLGESAKKLEDYGEGINQVVEALVEVGPSKPKSLADRLNQDPKKISSWLKRAQEYGLVTRADTHGTWQACFERPTEPPESTNSVGQVPT